MLQERRAAMPPLSNAARALRAQSGTDRVTELPEVAPAVLPGHLKFLDGRPKQPEAVSARDFFKTQELHEKMKSLALSDHFDSFGKVRFQRLGLTFAAKQMMPQMAAYGSVSEVPPAEKKKEKSAKAFILSQEALAQDLRRWTQHSRTLAESVQEEDRHKDAEVKQRQVAILFAELPRFLEYLPSSVPLASMEPELGRQEDPQARAAALRGNALLRQPASQRRFRQAEVLAVVQVLKAWSLASWPNGGAELGMDRSTFCRFLLDTGLADQRKVPFFWAVSLFDSSARLVRYCAEEEAAVGTAPLLPVVNWKDLWQILEALVQQYFRPSSSAMRLKFIESIAEISRARLPSFAVKMMNISKEHLNLMIQGVGTEDRDSDAEDERAKAPRSLRVPSAKARQLSILEEARKQRLRSLLVEPEVLQLLWQHEDVFKELHSAYADERGHLSFAAVVQLCKAGDERQLPNGTFPLVEEALMEILCKVAYTYLGCYGNMQQRSMSTLLQSVWLLVYLRFTVESFRRSLAQREEVEEEAPLLQAVRRLDPDAWVIDDAPDFEDGMPVQTAKVLPREAGELIPSRKDRTKSFLTGRYVN
ncbi:unnamed protein product [Effrenium voratum]|uniref:Uncharacterized protein n=1 Tax=Effrenium voratum TaxID=2562239 RepID=A0AA36JKS3_9DINO|nr:unnamed protein product [Effrenium voratum]